MAFGEICVRAFLSQQCSELLGCLNHLLTSRLSGILAYVTVYDHPKYGFHVTQCNLYHYVQVVHLIIV